MAESSPPQQQSQQRQQQQQQRQRHSLSSQPVAFTPGGEPGSYAVSRPVPPKAPTTSTMPSVEEDQPKQATQAHQRSGNRNSRRPPNTSSPSRAPPSWTNFRRHINEDDKEMVRKAQEEGAKLSGKVFRPELRETYKDRRGGKEVTVRQSSGGTEIQSPGSDQGRWEEESDDGGVKLQ